MMHDPQKREKMSTRLGLAIGIEALLLLVNLNDFPVGTSIYKMREFIHGWCGSLSYALPLLLFVFTTWKTKVPFIDLLMTLSLFSSVHLFYTPTIILEKMTIWTFSNFVSKSYIYGKGGGVIGALLAWPLCTYAGEKYSVIISILIFIACFVISMRLRGLNEFIADRLEMRKQPKAPVIQENIPLSDNTAKAPEPIPAQHLSPHRETRMAGPARRPRPDGVPRPRQPGGAMVQGLTGPCSLETAHCAVSRAFASSSPAPRRKKLYVESIDPQVAPIIDRDDFDDFDIPAGLSAEKIKSPMRKPERAFAPDRPSGMDVTTHARAEVSSPAQCPRTEQVPDEAPFDLPNARVDKVDLSKHSLNKMKLTVDEDAPEYNYPPIDLLASGVVEDNDQHAREDRERAQRLFEVLNSYGIDASMTGIAHGPATTTFEFVPPLGIKMNRITSLSDEIALHLWAKTVHIEAPIPGKGAVGVEIPNEKVEMVRLRSVLESQEARNHPSRIAIGLSKDNSGRYIVADIANMPHLLIAGQTGSGKSACLNAIIASILLRASPEEVRLILIDPRVVNLSVYNDIPHLVCPVVTDPQKAASALDWAVAEMTRRYKLFAERGVRDIKGYNKSLRDGEKPLPRMVIIIDELAEVMTISPKEVEESVCRLAQLAHVCGMHLVMTTQRVSSISNNVKNNIPARIAFTVATQADSRGAIGQGGAERLFGNGDMLFVPNGMRPMCVQGAWISDDEVRAIVDYIKQKNGITYDPDMLEHLENANRSDTEKEEFNDEYDPRLPEAIDIVLELGQASISMLQRRMRIGYARAGRLIDGMAQRGIVSEADGAKPRVVLMTREQINNLLENDDIP